MRVPLREIVFSVPCFGQTGFLGRQESAFGGVGESFLHDGRASLALRKSLCREQEKALLADRFV